MEKKFFFCSTTVKNIIWSMPVLTRLQFQIQHHHQQHQQQHLQQQLKTALN